MSNPPQYIDILNKIECNVNDYSINYNSPKQQYCFFFLKKKVKFKPLQFVSSPMRIIFFSKKKKRVTCHRQWWRRWLKWWTWLSFLDADSILRHEYFGIHTHTHFNTQLQSGYNEKNREDNKEKIGDWSSLVNLCLCTH
jgi:hypothetical protein